MDEFEIKAVEDAKREQELAYVLDTEAGRRFLWRLIAGQCGAFSSSFSESGTLQAYAQGRRDIGLELRDAVISFSKEDYLKMEDENS